MARFFFLKDRLDRETLERLYNQAGLSYVEIAERFGTRSSNVIRLMDEYGIERHRRRARNASSGTPPGSAAPQQERRA